MTTVLFIVLYFVLGVVLMGFTIFLFRKNNTFKKMCEIIDVDSVLEIKYAGNFAGLSCFYGVLWPFAVSIGIIMLPYAYIKYLDDNDWKIFEKKYHKCRRKSCPFRKMRKQTL